MTNQTIANIVVGVLKEIELDGEMMEYIVDRVGMRDQLIKQYQHPMRPCPCASEGFSNPCANTYSYHDTNPLTAEAPKTLTDLDLEDIATDLARYIARNADGIVDVDAVELSIYGREVTIDSCPIDEDQLAAHITDHLAQALLERGLYQN